MKKFCSSKTLLKLASGWNASPPGSASARSPCAQQMVDISVAKLRSHYADSTIVFPLCLNKARNLVSFLEVKTGLYYYIEFCLMLCTAQSRTELQCTKHFFSKQP